MEHSNRPTAIAAHHDIGRDALRVTHLTSSASLLKKLIETANLDESARQRIHSHAALLARAARRAAEHEGFALGLVHQFGLNTPQGIALMQLAEALPRTTDSPSARLLIADKIGALSWRDASGETSGVAQRAALHALDTLSKLFREVQVANSLDAGRPRQFIQGCAQSAIQTAIAMLSQQYVLGDTVQQALSNSRSLARIGYRFSFDMLGEAAMTDNAALSFQKSYLHAIDVLATQIGQQAISVKLSALHPRCEERQRSNCLPLLLARVKAIAVRAREANIAVTLDAEESDRLELTLDVFEHLFAAPEMQGWNGLGLAVQAYQRRAIHVLDWLAGLSQQHGKRITLRLVKGAYWDTEIKRAQQLGLSSYPVFMRKCETDVSYLACARRLLEQPARFFPQFATHNAHTLAAIVELAEQTGNWAYEYQRLHGMGEHLHTELLREATTQVVCSRIYAPIGPRRDLLPYLVRRLLENGASSSFVRQLTDKHVPIETLVRDPIAAASDHTKPQAIGAPNDVRHQLWPSAQGLDLTARDTSAALLLLLQSNQPPVIAGSLIDGVQQTGNAQPVFNPAHREQVIGYATYATEAIAVHAAVAAANGHAEWSATTGRARAAILEQAARLLEKQAPQFIRLAALEAGKTLDDAIGEVREAVDFCRYYAEQCRMPAMQGRQSLGSVVCISPWNFPLAIFLGQVTAALAAGNAVIAKPAEQTPLIAMLATRLLHDAGIPAHALQLVLGDGRIGGALVGHATTAAVCFTGSLATAKAIGGTLAKSDRAALPFIAETGGINAMIVDSSALPEQVVRDVLASAFQSAGQRCSALRLLCLQDETADHILSLLTGALQNLCVGDPTQLATDLGPVIDAEAQQHISDYLKSRTVLASAPIDATVAANGWYVAPSIIEVSRVCDVQQEVFGPVLHVMRFAANNLAALVQEINAQGYGLTLGIHSRIRKRVQSITQNTAVGNVYVNRHQVGAVVGQQPFGGHGLSGTGPKAGGPHYLLRLSRPTLELKSQVSQPYGESLNLVAQLPGEHSASLLARVRRAQVQWHHTARRSEMIRFACQLLSANGAQPFSALANNLRLPVPAAMHLTLASVAGENNELHLLPRGVLLCLGAVSGRAEALAAQLMISVASGNGVIAIASAEHAQSINELVASLQQSGMPNDLVALVEMPRGHVPQAWLTDLAIDGVVYDSDTSDDRDRHKIAACLQRRAGAIVPLLSSADDTYRFFLEQTITTNTAAAGGDPHLLAVSG